MPMLPALIVLMTLPHGGHVRSGTVIEIEVQPVLASLPEALDLAWQLTYGPFVVGEGRLSVPDAGSTLKLDIPEVRARTAMRLHYQVQPSTPDTELIDHGSLELLVYPPVADTEGHIQLAEIVGHDIVHIDAQLDAGLNLLFDEMELGVTPVSAEEVGRIIVSPWIVVGQDAMTPALEKTLGRAMQRGARVIVLNQHTAAKPGTAYARRAVTPATGHPQHPLLAGIDPLWIDSRLAASRSTVVRRVTDEEYAVVGWTHPEARLRRTPSDRENKAEAIPDQPDPVTSKTIEKAAPAPLPPLFDAIVWTRRVGDGHQVHWQVPISDWSQDPLAYEIIFNTVIYLAYAPSAWDGRLGEAATGATK